MMFVWKRYHHFVIQRHVHSAILSRLHVFAIRRHVLRPMILIEAVVSALTRTPKLNQTKLLIRTICHTAIPPSLPSLLHSAASPAND